MDWMNEWMNKQRDSDSPGSIYVEEKILNEESEDLCSSSGPDINQLSVSKSQQTSSEVTSSSIQTGY